MEQKRAYDIKKSARAALTEDSAFWRFFIGLFLMGIVLGAAVGVVAALVVLGGVITAAAVDFTEVPGLQELMRPEGWAQIPKALWVYAATAAAAVSVIAVYLIGFACWVKAAMGIAAMRRGLTVGHAFSGWGHGWRMGWIALVKLTYIQLWALLLVVPGIVKALSYAMTDYLAVDHPDWTASQCIDESRRLMDGNKARLFRLWLSFAPWFLLLYVFSIPKAFRLPFAQIFNLTGNLYSQALATYVLTSVAAFYEDLLDQQDAALAPDDLLQRERHDFSTVG